jgi:hypothetical protein
LLIIDCSDEPDPSSIQMPKGLINQAITRYGKGEDENDSDSERENDDDDEGDCDGEDCDEEDLDVECEKLWEDEDEDDEEELDAPADEVPVLKEDGGEKKPVRLLHRNSHCQNSQHIQYVL